MLEAKVIVDCFRAIRDVLSDANKAEDQRRARSRERARAIGAVRAAALATKAYLYDTRVQGTPVDRVREADLSRLWQEAADAIREYDFDLFSISNVKALGWSDPREWEEIEIPEAKLKVDLLIRQCDWLLEHSDSPGQS